MCPLSHTLTGSSITPVLAALLVALSGQLGSYCTTITLSSKDLTLRGRRNTLTILSIISTDMRVALEHGEETLVVLLMDWVGAHCYTGQAKSDVAVSSSFFS